MKKVSIQIISALLLVWVVFMGILPAHAHPIRPSNTKIDLPVLTAQALTPVDWADHLIADLKPKNNVYGSRPTAYIQWRGVDGATVSKNRTVCSSFVTRLLQQSYGYPDSEIENWLGTDNPKAATYYDTIAQQKRFQLVTRVNDIQSGDLLAIQYLENAQTGTDEEPDTDENGRTAAQQCPKRSTATGHIVLVREAPVVRQSSRPIQQGLIQYSLTVIDSSRSGHGCQDTRLLPNKSCSDSDAWGKGGAGKGTMRLYADQDGAIAGYTWSLRAQSTYYGKEEYTNEAGCKIPGHPLVVGRLLN